MDRDLNIIYSQKLSDSIYWHRRISFGQKDFGLLMGHVKNKEDNSIHIEGVFPIGRLSNAADTLGGLKWPEIKEKAMEKYPDKEIVGWYGMRNGWGAMMMEEDQYVHRNYFDRPWQVMYLLDDRGGLKNFYIWSNDSLILYKPESSKDPLDILKEGRGDGKKPLIIGRHHYRWIYAVLVVIILAAISYPILIRPFVKNYNAVGKDVERTSPKEKEVVDKQKEKEDEHSQEIANLKEVIKGLEDALDKTGQDLYEKEQELKEKTEKKEDMSEKLDENEKKIKELEKIKEKFESQQITSGMKVYEFKDGDTLSGLSSRFYGNSKYGNDLGRINRIADHSAIRPGTYLIIPPSEIIEDIYRRNTSQDD
ncbi:MAG: LysM peptidoglycan-binding domain-containing protein [Clostridiales bacterium]|nr:LysM peptidoglycan-binding domain-containing protein [Clostridiales bacterium]